MAEGFTKPSKVITPLNVMELAIRPLSLCMRLFGNVMGAFVVMKLLEHLVPVILPAVFSLYFDFFDRPAAGLCIRVPHRAVYQGSRRGMTQVKNIKLHMI